MRKDDGWSETGTSTVDSLRRAKGRQRQRRGLWLVGGGGMRGGRCGRYLQERDYRFSWRRGGGEGLCEEKRVHVSEIWPVGGAVVFMREEGRRRDGLDLQLPGQRVGYCVSAAIAVGHTVAGGWACRGGDWLRPGQVKCATPSLAGATLRRSQPSLFSGETKRATTVYYRDCGTDEPDCIGADRVFALFMTLLSASFLFFRVTCTCRPTRCTDTRACAACSTD